MNTQDYNKASDRLQAFSRIARAEINKNRSPLKEIGQAYLQYNILMNKIWNAVYKATGL